MQNLLAVGLGGFLGAIARYTIGQFVQSRLASRFPWGTLAVNVIGCLLIGILLGWISGRENVSKSTELFLVTGPGRPSSARGHAPARPTRFLKNRRFLCCEGEAAGAVGVYVFYDC